MESEYFTQSFPPLRFFESSFIVFVVYLHQLKEQKKLRKSSIFLWLILEVESTWIPSSFYKRIFLPFLFLFTVLSLISGKLSVGLKWVVKYYYFMPSKNILIWIIFFKNNLINEESNFLIIKIENKISSISTLTL